MSTSDEDAEFVPDQVSKYYFVDENEDPISFAVLPFQWSDGQKTGGTEERVVLHGIADSGQQKVYQPVVAWKLELSSKKPTMSVLSKDEKWIELCKPRQSYEEMIRSALIMVQALHFAYTNPNALEKDLWENLRKTFSIYEPEPSDDDLLEHRSLIREIVERHEVLSNAKVAQLLVEGTSKKRKSSIGDVSASSDTKKSKFIVDDDNVDDDDDNLDGDKNLEEASDDSDDSEEESDLFDSVCAICDNGGDLLCCDGCCLRSFHATIAAGSDSDCASLRLSIAQVKAFENFYCVNCKYKLHQCFVCGQLGCSDKSSNPEVFQCVSATCGHFYHPRCVVGLLYPDNEAEARMFEKKIAAGEPFTCPVHKCVVCKLGEDKENKEMQFAACRRCPKTYHRKCLPRKIAFEDIDDEGIIQRAWDDLIPDRVLIYCLKHKIDEELGTPIRNHIIFPEAPLKRKMHPVSHEKIMEKSVLKKRKVSPEGVSQGERATKAPKKNEAMDSTVTETESCKRSAKAHMVKGVDAAMKSKTSDVTKKSNSIVALKVKPSTLDPEDKVTNSMTVSPLGRSKLKGETPEAVTMKKASASQPVVDTEAEKRVTAIMDKWRSSLTLEDIVRKQKAPSIYLPGSKQFVTYGKAEGSVEAIKAALKKLEEGGSIEDAKAVCEPQMLKQVMKWKTRLRVYLAPFLHGARYTSFGRHFTKPEKLEEIVKMLHWYIKTGDSIVDFCCGANDFSRLLKNKLEETGKKCSFKNYDLIRPKNDLDFEKRDWMTVQRNELPTGSRLIMGLNPPFGVRAALANKCIDKALEFRPKLIVLIVPPETERLDAKKNPYDLIWEDAEMFKGKAFYLPGSLDMEDNDISQWNTKAPILYLWSRPDWTSKHRSIAAKEGHISKDKVESASNGEEKVRDAEARTEKSHLDVQTENSCGRFSETHIEEVVTEPEKRMATSLSDLKGFSGIERDDKVKNDKVVGDQKIKNVDKVKNDIIIGDQRSKSVDKLKNVRLKGGKESKNVDKSDRINLDQNSKNIVEKADQVSGKHFKGRTEKHKGEEDHYLANLPTEVMESTSISKERPSEVFKSPNLDAKEETHEPRLSSSAFMDVGTRSGGWQNNDNEIDDIERRYSRTKDDMFPTARSHWASPSAQGFRSGMEPEYRHHSLEDRYSSFQRENNNETFRAGTLPRPYVDDLDEKYGRPDLDARLQVRLYGQHASDDFTPQRSAYPLEQERSRMGTLVPYSALGRSGSSAVPPYDQLNPSTIQRYAPRLDELSYSRPNLHTPETPFDRGTVVFGSTMTPGSQGGFQRPSLRYSSESQRNFLPRDASGGWIND